MHRVESWLIAGALILVSDLPPGTFGTSRADVRVAGCLVDSASASPVVRVAAHFRGGRDTTVSDSTGFFQLTSARGGERDTLDLDRLGYGNNHFVVDLPLGVGLGLPEVDLY